MAMFNSESKHFHMHKVKRTQGIVTKQLWSLMEITYQWGWQVKKRFKLA